MLATETAVAPETALATGGVATGTAVATAAAFKAADVLVAALILFQNAAFLGVPVADGGGGTFGSCVFGFGVASSVGHGFAATAAFSEVKQLTGFGRQWSEKHHLGFTSE